MGIYSNYAFNRGSVSTGVNYDYTSVAPFTEEHVNYHELGIIAATESAINTDSFMKAIALSELAAVEQTGSEEVFYEAINFGSILDKVKAFFKSIIEKIHKIFHTFIAKMSSWFGGNKQFAKKYEKEVIKGWANVKSDWEFKGYDFTNVQDIMTKSAAESVSDTAVNANSSFKSAAALLNVKNQSDFETALKKIIASTPGSLTLKSDEDINGKTYPAGTEVKVKKIGATNSYYIDDNGTEVKVKSVNVEKVKGSSQDLPTDTGEDVSKFRDAFNENGKDNFRKIILDNIKTRKVIIPSEIKLDDLTSSSNGLDQKEFTEELFKTFRGDEDSQTELDKSSIEKCYGSISSMMNFIKDYDKIKSALEKAEKNMVKGIDDLIKALNKAEDAVVKDKGHDADGERLVQFSSTFQSFWGFVKETQTQAFSALLQAVKDACVQAKAIAVKVIGQGKKMTEESYDYSSSGDFDFISSVKLV